MTNDAGFTLAELGWTEALAGHFEPFAREGLIAARVAVEHRTKYGVYTERGETDAALTGTARHEAVARIDRPAVGDWVAMTPPPTGGAGAIGRERGARDRNLDRGLPSIAVIAKLPFYR